MTTTKAAHTAGENNLAAILKLRPREVSVIAQAMAARAQYGTPNMLLACDKGTVNAAIRMIERGYLSKGTAKMSPPAPWEEWPVVRFTEKNRKKILADAAEARANG